jgi:hypothetical protein
MEWRRVRRIRGPGLACCWGWSSVVLILHSTSVRQLDFDISNSAWRMEIPALLNSIVVTVEWKNQFDNLGLILM